MTVLYVALGSALGGVCRYLVSMGLNTSAGFPWGTLAVNVLGALMIGALSGWMVHVNGPHESLRAFAVVGVCGGFTTFSTFSNESFRMIQAGRWGWMFFYVLVSILGGLIAVWSGYALSGGLVAGNVQK